MTRLVLLAVVLSSTAMSSTSGVAHGSSPQIGFSFSPYAAEYRGLEPHAALATLLKQLNPDVVRLPVYWRDVAPSPGVLDFTRADWMVTAVADHNRKSGGATQVILIVGARNMGFPEVWAPSWLPNSTSASTEQLEASPAYSQYVSATIAHYAANPLLRAWQVENEPLDNVETPLRSQTSLSPTALDDEVAAVRQLDPGHRIIVTTYNSASLDLDEEAIADPSSYNATSGPRPAGHPSGALASGDVLGLDLYVITSNTRAGDASAQQRIQWKADELRFWRASARTQKKSAWIMEMQAEPFPTGDQFTAADLVASARYYRFTGTPVIIMWGAESWLTSSEWMNAATMSFSILRGQHA